MARSRSLRLGDERSPREYDRSMKAGWDRVLPPDGELQALEATLWEIPDRAIDHKARKIADLKAEVRMLRASLAYYRERDGDWPTRCQNLEKTLTILEKALTIAHNWVLTLWDVVPLEQRANPVFRPLRDLLERQP